MTRGLILWALGCMEVGFATNRSLEPWQNTVSAMFAILAFWLAMKEYGKLAQQEPKK